MALVDDVGLMHLSCEGRALHLALREPAHGALEEEDGDVAELVVIYHFLVDGQEGRAAAQTEAALVGHGDARRARRTV